MEIREGKISVIECQILTTYWIVEDNSYVMSQKNENIRINFFERFGLVLIICALDEYDVKIRPKGLIRIIFKLSKVTLTMSTMLQL